MTDHPWSTVVQSEVPTYYVYNKAVEKSSSDDRDYRFIKLTNGMEAVIIHDADADSAAASMYVSSGFLLDPDDKPGLAHFCEHLLFMGSELYPDENGFEEILAKNNGYANAVMSASSTKFYFSVSADALSEVLPRFAAFFHCPLFSPSAVTREVNAVNAEFMANSQDDDRRVSQLDRHLSKDGHVWRKFGTGNVRTLLGPEARNCAEPLVPSASAADASDSSSGCSAAALELRRRVVEWWSTHYGSNRMCLAVSGKESLDELSDTVTRHFSPVKNRALLPMVPVYTHPFGPEQYGTLVSVALTAPAYELRLSFAVRETLSRVLETHPRRYDTKSFLLNLIHRRGPGSLHAYLKRKDWAVNLSTGADGFDQSFDTLVIDVSLTENGFSNQHEVIRAVLEYLAFLHAQHFDSWRQSERCKIAQLKFKFQEKQSPVDLVTWLCAYTNWHRISPVPREHFVKYANVMDDWDDPDEGNRILHALLEGMTLENGRVGVGATREEHERLREKIDWVVEPTYGTLYMVERVDLELLRETMAPITNDAFQLPAANTFLPNDVSVERSGGLEPVLHPDLVHQSKSSCLWFKKDDQFWVPRSFVKVKIMSAALAERSQEKRAMFYIFYLLVVDALSEELWDAPVAGSTWDEDLDDLGMTIGLSGYSDTIETLLERIMCTMRNLCVDPVRLQAVRDVLLRCFESLRLTDPEQTAAAHLSFVTDLYDLSEPRQNLIEAIESVRLQQFIPEFFACVSFRTLVIGNSEREKAVQLQELAERVIAFSSPTTHITNKFMILPEGINTVYRATVDNPDEPTSVLNYYVQVGVAPQSRLVETALLLTRLLSEPAFDTLRTKEQLGYSVSCSGYNRFPIYGLNIIIRGDRNPAYLEERVEAFLLYMHERLQAMAGDDYAEHQSGARNSVTERPTNLVAEGDRMWADIEKCAMGDHTNRIDLDVLASITKQEVLELFVTRVLPSPQRRKFSVHLWSQKELQPSTAVIETARAILAEEGVSDDVIASLNNHLDDETISFNTIRMLQDAGLSGEKVEALLARLSLEDKGASQGIDLTAYYGHEWDSVVFIEDLCSFKDSLEVASIPSDDA